MPATSASKLYQYRAVGSIALERSKRYDFNVKRRFLMILVWTLVPLAIAHGSALDPSKRQATGDRSKRPAKQATSMPTSSKGTAALQRQFRSAMSAGDLNRATEVLSEARTALTLQKAGTTSDETARWLLSEAELELAKGRAAKAGLAAMRVVVQRPKSEFAGEGLYWTARAYEQLDRPGKAAELYRECLERKRLAASIRKTAEERLAALDKKVRPK